MRLAFFLLFLPLTAATFTVQTQPIATNAVLGYSVPSGASCTMSATANSPFGSYTPNDINPSVFSGSNVDTTHAGTVQTGNYRQVVLGSQTVAQSSSGTWVSRALEANTSYSGSLTCGSDSATFSFVTANPPLGAAPRWLPNLYNASRKLNTNQPGVDWTNKSTFVIDPYSGLRIYRVTGPGEGDVGTASFISPNLLAQPNSTWTNPGAIISGGSGSATYSGSGTSADYILLFVPPAFNPSHDTSATPLNAFTLDDMLLRLTGFGGDATQSNRNMLACLVSTQAPGTCITGNVTLSLPQSVGAEVDGPGTLISSVWQTAPTFSQWGLSGLPSPTTKDNAQFSGTLTSSGASITLNTGSFDPNWQSGTLIKITGSGCSTYGITGLCQISSMSSSKTGTLTASITTVSGAAFSVENLGIKLWKQTGTGSITLTSLRFDYAYSNALTTGAEGDDQFCSPNAVTVSAGVSGYLCAFPDNSFAYHLYVWIPSTGEMRYLSPLVLTSNASGCLQWNGTTWTGTCNAANANSTTYAAPSITWDQSSGTTFYVSPAPAETSNKVMIYKGVYTGNFSLYYRNYQEYVDNPALTWTNLTPASTGSDITSLIHAFNPSIPISYFPTTSFVGGVGRYWAVLLYVQQNSIAWMCTVDSQTLSVVACSSTYTQAPNRFGSMHGAGGYQLDNWASWYISPLEGSDGGQGVETYTAAISTVNTAHTGPGTAVASTDGESCADAPAPTNPTPPGGSTCLSVTIANDFVNKNPATADQTTFPWPHNSTACGGDNTTANCWAMLQASQSGDYTVDPATGQAFGERLVIIHRTDNGNGTYTLWLWRVPGTTSTCASAAESHSNGWVLQAIPASTCNGNFFWMQNTDTNGSSQIADDPGATTGHAATGFSASSNAISSWLAAGSSEGPGTSYCSRPGASIASFVGSHCATFLPNFAQFAGSSPTTDMQTHPSLKQILAPPSEQVWALDGHPFGGAGGSFGPTQVYTPTITSTATTGVYKVSANSTIDIKRLPVVFMAPGGRMLTDISGPSSVLATGNTWTQCIVYTAGECVAASSAGDVYVNIPAMETTTGGWTNLYDTNSAGVDSAGPDTAQIVQLNWSSADSQTTLRRNLGFGLNHPGSTDNFWNVHPDPAGQWGFFQCTWCENFRIDIFAARLPPWPPYDTVNRSQFVQVPIQLSGRTGDTVRIEFGYQEFGAPSNLDCTSRGEACFTSASATQSNPFLFASETQSYTSCGSGCTVNIPALPGRMLYYRIHRKNASSIEAIGSIQILAVQ